ncbi:MAG TPA: VOC family protein [Lacunisphaera sp.]|nr:VOC family protein [Lacunisphaera sp.]
MGAASFICLALASTVVIGRAAAGAEAGKWVEPDASNSALEMNFLGIVAADWPSACEFYTKRLGVRLTATNPTYGNWAQLGAGWDEHASGKSRSMILELFEGGPAGNNDRRWGHRQGIRPSIQVDNLDAMVAAARARGVMFTGEIETVAWGRRIEFSAPDGVRWTLSEARGRPAGSDLALPLIGHVELKAHDVAGQKAFYRDVMGLQFESEDARGIILVQGPGKAWLTIEPGGERQANSPAASRTALGQPINQPLFISFMTHHLDQVAARLKKAGVTILRGIERHPDWGGTDLIITDVDGNAIQVVQYGL